MSIELNKHDDIWVLIYTPEILSPENVKERFQSGCGIHLMHTFHLSMSKMLEQDEEGDSLYFVLGEIGPEYTEIDQSILGTENRVFFSNEIRLKKEYFVAYRNIAVLPKLSRLIGTDIYIGGANESNECIPTEVFESLIQCFPNSTELNHYVSARISSILKEYIPTLDEKEVVLQRYLERKEKATVKTEKVSSTTVFHRYKDIELDQFKDIRNQLKELLSRSEGEKEYVWQEQIHGLLRIIYPKYVAAIREVTIEGVDRYDKRPDFMLVDASGFVDILEIKKPDVQVLTRIGRTYRNNYVPVRELAGAVQQIEKYIYCLNSLGKSGEKRLAEQLKGKIPEGIELKIANPQGMLLLGRSRDFNAQQVQDFELIKRQYKHVTDIMTYDDLLNRIDNIIAALSMQ